MDKRARRILVTLAVLAFAALIIGTAIYGRMRGSRQNQSAATQPTATAAQPSSSEAPIHAATSPAAAPTTAPAATALQPIGVLRAAAAGNDLGPRDQPPQPLGSLDPRAARMQVRLSRFGAGIERIAFADIWLNATAKREAHRYLKSLQASDPIDFSQLPDSDRYVLVARTPSKTPDGRYNQVPVTALRNVEINGVVVELINDECWSETAPGEFQCRIVDADGKDVALITRRYSLGDNFDINIEQRFRNLTSQPIELRWHQYGPVDLPVDRASDYIERRRLHFGYLPDPHGRPSLVLAGDNMTRERGSAIGNVDDAHASADPQEQRELLTAWPDDTATSKGYGLSWCAMTNRYFGLAMHPLVRDGAPVAASLSPTFAEIELGASGINTGNDLLFTILHSPAISVAPGVEHALDVAIYAGPLDREILNQEPYEALSMSGMIIYSMAGCCTWLTFQWLAHLLLWFLAFLHDYIVFDWGLAIIGLVCVVRTLLHPLTKKSQINMQRFGKQMQALKPEIDKLQKKFGSDPKRMQAEQLKLMREHGVNPLQMLGCLPLFLQMPIWIALWAMLYLAWDIHQQPAFYGVFQLFGNWPFLADLSTQDNFIPLGAGFTIPLVNWHVSAINLLPLLMGLVFFIQQKYMTPPPGPNVTPEMKQQQVIMKWMLVLMMPLFMYKAPSGLTLYIMTSSIIGILESRYVRRHIEQMDLTPKPGGAAKPKGALGRAWAERLEALRQRQQQRMQQQQQRSFKKRK
jgi:YidC/Oxa1 family membrane protein insertase